MQLQNQSQHHREALRLSLLGLSLLGAAYFAIGVLTLSPAYVDFGDGNYLYISKRISEGLRVYRDIVSPQPPLHLFSGAALLKLGGILGNELYTIRVFLLLWHLATMSTVALVAWRLWKSPLVVFLSGLIFLILPIGFWWSRGYQSENWLILWLTWAFYLLLPVQGEAKSEFREKRRLVLAGLLSVLAIYTNMTALPYVVLFIIFVPLRFGKKSLAFFVPFVVVSAVLLLIMMWYSEGAYIENVWSNQIGTYPKENTLQYFAGKISSQGIKILYLEGALLLLALLGLARYMSKKETPARMFVTWYALFCFGSILFVTKGGTMDYIFSLAEPALAVFAAWFIRDMIVELGLNRRQFWSERACIIPALILFPTILAVLLYPALRFEAQTFAEETYENNTEGVLGVVDFIEQHSEPGDLVLMPAYYAFLTGRRLPLDCSSSYMWFMRWFNAHQSGAKDPKVDLLLDTVTGALRRQEIRIVFLHKRQFGLITPIRQAVETHYRSVSRLQTLNEDLEIFLPEQ